jgi:hypothetical protein
MGSALIGFNTIRFFFFFAWDFIKSKVYTGRRIGDLAEVRNRTIDAVQKSHLWKVCSGKQFTALSSVESMKVAMWRQINSTNYLWHLL